jgi:glycosyltransferase involved in cell wall biosynthesis
MGKRRPIVCFSMSQWSDIPHNSRHLMRVAHSRGSNVLYVESIGLRNPQLTRRDLSKIARRLRRMLAPLRKVADGYWVLAPVALPLQGWRSIGRINKWLLGAQIRIVLRAIGFKKPLIWSYLPEFVTLRDRLDAQEALYYRTDDYGSMPGVNIDALETAERAAVAVADLCVAPAKRYFDGPLRLARRSLWVPNAVELPNYVDRGGDDPYRSLARPVLLTAGTLESWLAADLLAEVAQIRPAWSLVFAGPVKTDLDDLFERTNVHYLGVLPYRELSRYLRHADVGLIPFRLGKISAGATPGKLYQYLAAGLPVVATDFLDDEGAREHVYSSPEDAEAFVQAVEHALAQDDEPRRAARRAYARENSWDARFDLIESALHFGERRMREPLLNA